MTNFWYDFGGALASAVVMTCPFWIPALVIYRRDKRNPRKVGRR